MNRRHALVFASFWPLALMEYALAAPDLIANPSTLPMRNLLIEVRQVQSDDSQRTGVELGNRPGVQMNQSRNSGSATQQALVLNGRPVRLGLQTTTPIRLLQGFVRNGRVVTTVGTVLLEAGTGFSATPRWDGGALVELELAAQQALRSGSALPGATATSGTSSVLALPLDEWTRVGESEQSSQSSTSGLTGGQQQSGVVRTEVQVRVSVR
ncbi:hypothetical protein [Rhodoferax sp. TS-BS-61-7]|uniref:hypothetical protein n=1 Tax=Rhodoferax sp. TS-BS-61-7 TaxID=2094194 RepID=UPI0011B0EE28|nr:hypothetical protein [Rhodoferax sp. TS-BS-61-7]